MKTMRLHKQHKLRMVFVNDLSKVMEFRNFELKYTMFSVPDRSDAGDSSKSQNKSFLKVNYFIQQMLDNSFIYTMENLPGLINFASEYENNFLVLPDVSDTTLLEALHCKLNVICGDSTYIEDLVLIDTDHSVGYEIMTDEEAQYSLPSAIDWMGELSFWDQPWWMRYDVTTFDNFAESITELEQFRQSDSYGGALQSEFDEIDKEVDLLFNQMQGKVGEIVDLDQIRSDINRKGNNWKPTLV
jgi:hypothetical protein